MDVNFIYQLIIFIFGLTIGSFLNCVIYRLETGDSFLKGRSFCPFCKHKLLWLDLIPIFSFIFLKGKCRYCGKKISWQYPLVEVSLAILSLFSFIFFPDLPFSLWKLFYYWLLISFLIIIFVFDLKYFIVLDKIIYPLIILVLLFDFHFLFLKQYATFYNLILSALAAGLFFLIIVLISNGKWMGIGDIKISFFMGLFLGFPNILVALFLSFLIGAIIGIGLILAKKKTLKSEVPFGPFLVIGTLIALFWGEKIVSYYLVLFNI